MSRTAEYFSHRDDGWRDVDQVSHPGVRKLLGLLEHVKPSTSENPKLVGSYAALCPAHADASPSLSVGWWENGRVSIHCFAGCSRDAVLRAVGMTPDEVAPPRRAKA